MGKGRFVPREIFEQNDNQTCLPCCLLMYYGVLFPDRKIDFQQYEEKLDKASYGLYREYYALAHTAAFVREFRDVSATIFVDNPEFAAYLAAMNQEERIQIDAQPITMKFINKTLKKSPLILETDVYYLKRGTVHAQHFLYLFQDGQKKVVDPEYGELRTITNTEIEYGYTGLKFSMLWSPIVIIPKIINPLNG